MGRIKRREGKKSRQIKESNGSCHWESFKLNEKEEGKESQEER